jgi:hypothetical protein
MDFNAVRILERPFVKMPNEVLKRRASGPPVANAPGVIAFGSSSAPFKS